MPKSTIEGDTSCQQSMNGPPVAGTACDIDIDLFEGIRCLVNLCLAGSNNMPCCNHVPPACMYVACKYKSLDLDYFGSKTLAVVAETLLFALWG
jgi:hypothetical protein